MPENMQTTVHVELRGFFALSVMNIVFAALTMAIGISAVVTNILAILQAGEVAFGSGVLLLLGGIAAAVGFWWLPQSARMLGDVQDLRGALENGGSEEDLLRVMIRMTALYRDRRPTVRRMIQISRIGGAVFLALGVANLAGAMIGASDPMTLYGGLIAAALNIGLGGAALYTSILFGRYSAAWDARLDESARAEAALTRTMEMD